MSNVKRLDELALLTLTCANILSFFEGPKFAKLFERQNFWNVKIAAFVLWNLNIYAWVTKIFQN